MSLVCKRNGVTQGYVLGPSFVMLRIKIEN